MPTPRDEQHAATMIEGVNSTANLLGLNRPTYNGTEVLTDEKVKEVQRVVEAWFTVRGCDAAPALYPPGHEGPMWVLSLEGYDDWATDVSNDDVVKWPAGVWVEPVTAWCLGLYPVT